MRRALVTVLLSTAAALGLASERLTLEVATGAALRDAMSTPDYAWLEDGSALLYDRRVPPAGRTVERLDPATGRRTPAVDRGKAMASLAFLMDGEGETPPEALPWPAQVHPGGRVGLVELDGDLYLLYLRGSTFRRVTRTAEEETCARLSPDGTSISFVRGNDLYLHDLGRETERRLTSDGSPTLLNGTLSWVYWEEVHGREDIATWWAPDASALAFLQTDQSMVSEALFPGFDPEEHNVERQRYPRAGRTNPEVRLGVVELADGAVTWVDLGQPRPEYVVRVQWLPDSAALAVQTLDRAQQRLELRLVDRQTGASTVVLTETSSTWVSPVDDLRFLDGASRFLWSSEREGFRRLAIHRRDGTPLRALSPPTVALRPSSGLGHVKGSVVAVDEAGGWVYYTAVEGLPVAPALYRSRLEGVGSQRVSTEVGTHRVGFDRDARHYLDRFATVSSPPGLFLHRSDGERLATVSAPAADVVARYGLQTPELLTYTTDDGLRLPAQLLVPPGFDPARRHPVILHVYGGPQAPTVVNDWQRDTPVSNVLLNAGFVLAGADNRSATPTRKDWADTSHGRLMSAREVPDILAFVRWLKAQTWVDPERVGVWGWSGGGTFTLHLMTRSREFKAGVAVAAVTDFRFYDTVWTEAFLGLPQANPEGYRLGAATTHAGELSGRLLLVHGLDDDNVHPQNAWSFARALVDAGTSFDMMVYPGERHGIRGARRHVWAAMLEFWQRWL